MLVLTRKRNERLVIDDRIVITVVDVRGDKVRLGVDAPQDVPVDREEVWESKRRNRREATAKTPQASGLKPQDSDP